MKQILTTFFPRNGPRPPNVAFVNRAMYGAGFSLAIDKLVIGLTQFKDINTHRSVVDLIVYVTGNRQHPASHGLFMQSLWRAGIKCCFLESPSQLDDEDSYARNLGANHIILLGEDGCLRVKSWQQDRYLEKSVTRFEIIDYLKRNLNADITALSENLQQNLALSRNNSISSISSKNFETSASGSSVLEVIFIMSEKPNATKRRRLENHIEQKFGNVMQKFNKKENLAVFAVEIDAKQVKILISCIDPNPKDQSPSDFDCMIEKSV